MDVDDVDVDRLGILVYPDPALRRKAAPVKAVDDRVRAIAARMIQLMHEADGVGLAAPQVGLGLRMFVARDPEDAEAGDRVFIDPVLSEPGAEQATREEGCLSLPGIHVQVRRPVCMRIDATGLDGERFTLTSDAFFARVWQHENDHLDGVLILDKMSPLDKLANRRSIKELEGA